MIKIEAKADIAATIKSLNALGLDLKRVGRKILRALATITKKRIKKRMGTYLRLHHDSGHMLTGLKGGKLKGGDTGGGLQAATYGFARSNTHAVVSSGMVWQAEILERGGTIRPKKAKMLSFFGDDGNYHRAKSVTIPAKRWFTRSVDGFEADPDYQLTMDKVIGKAIHVAGLGR